MSHIPHQIRQHSIEVKPLRCPTVEICPCKMVSEVISSWAGLKLKIREGSNPESPEVTGNGAGSVTLLSMREIIFSFREHDADFPVIFIKVFRKLAADEYPSAFRTL